MTHEAVNDAPATDRVEPSVWSLHNYRWLFGAHATSEIGTYVTMAAIPIVAVTLLNASAFEVSVISAARYLPFLVLSVWIGQLIDRWPRKPPLIAADLLRGVTLLAIPVLYLLDALTLAVVLAVALLHGTWRVFFDIGHQAMVPRALPPSRLTDANAGFESVSSLGRIGGPGIAGALLAVLAAPLVLVLDVFSFFVSAFAISKVKLTPSTPRSEADGTARVRLLDGFRHVFANKTLLAIAISGAVSNMALMAFQAVYFVVALRLFDLTVAQATLVPIASAIGSFAGSALSPRLGRRLGVRVTMVAGYVTILAGSVVILASPVGAVSMVTLGAGYLLWGGGLGLFNVHSVSFRQRVVPADLMGRVGGAYRVLVFGALPVGAVVGGISSELLGMRGGLVVPVLLNAAALVLLTLLMTTRKASHDALA